MTAYLRAFLYHIRLVVACQCHTGMCAVHESCEREGFPRPSRTGWLITPDTLLRSHRRRIVGHWIQPQ